MTIPNYTPMMQQYLEIKEKYKDEILFFRLGDFYEMFFSDAELVAGELGLALTGKMAGVPERVPMCGVPYHAADNYIARLVKKGYKVAICEQVESAKDVVKGIVRREVIKTITAGTALADNLLNDTTNQYIIFAYEQEECIALIIADVSTGSFKWLIKVGEQRLESICEQLLIITPAEIVCHRNSELCTELEKFVQGRMPEAVLSKYTPSSNICGHEYVHKHFGNIEAETNETVIDCANFLLDYLHTTLQADLKHINKLERIATEKFMIVDSTALRNLELLRNMRDGAKKGTLLETIDYTITTMGVRQLRRYIEEPLFDIVDIKRRQNFVGELLDNLCLRDGLRELLKKVADIERIMARLDIGTANAKDLLSLKNTLQVLPAIKVLATENIGENIKKVLQKLPTHLEIAELLSRAIVDEPPFSLREGGFIRDCYNSELDELRNISKDSHAWMAAFEQKERETTGIKNLRISYNKIFGYCIEITKSNLGMVPDYYIRKQTLANVERYILPELKEFENKILGAKEKIEQLEFHLFNELREIIHQDIIPLQRTAVALAKIDALLSLATVAHKYNYICPELNNNNIIKIIDGRHPVVERLLDKEMFVPNDININNAERTLIITGPNMAGKSTYLRQIAILVLLTQIGSFIPATAANICPVDRIFTRVGASDDLSVGQSTFMVEMVEVANILKCATANSLIILDEVGRGTSTYDGISIARSVLEHIHQKIKAKTLFATHYHELIEMEETFVGLKNFSTAVKERGKEIKFLRRIIPGGADRSYGIHVAALAGLPKKVIERAENILTGYDNDQAISTPQQKVTVHKMENSLFASGVAESLLKYDVLSLTPLEAMSILMKLQDEARAELGK